MMSQNDETKEIESQDEAPETVAQAPDENNDALAAAESPSIVPSAFAMGDVTLEQILEAALMAAGEPLSVEQLCALFEPNDRPHGRDVRKALQAMAELREGTALELKEVASGWRFQVREQFAPWVKRLFSEKPQRYSRALLETLAIIGYRQPVTRGEIEEIRGVAVSTNIMRTLQEREWIRVLGHKELPGRPAMYGTTREFLDYFNLKSLDELPSLAELQDLDKINIDLDLPHPDQKHSEEPSDSQEAEVELPQLELAEGEDSDTAEAEGEPLIVSESPDTVH